MVGIADAAEFDAGGRDLSRFRRQSATGVPHRSRDVLREYRARGSQRDRFTEW